MGRKIGQIFVTIMMVMLLTGCQKTVIYKGQVNGVTTEMQEEEDAQKETEVKGFCMGIVTDITNDTITIAVFSAAQAGNTMDNSIPAKDESTEEKEDESKKESEKPYRLEITEEELKLQITDQTEVRIDNDEDSEDGEQADIDMNSAVCVKYNTETMEAAVIIIKVF